MKLLALDTATEQCSAALSLDGRVMERSQLTQRSHAELILPMIDELLKEAGVTLQELDALAFGRGPGAFTGVRIAVGVAQGLALGAGLPVVPISNLAAVAQQDALPGMRVLVCMDARMSEVYWASFAVGADGLVSPTSEERVSSPAQVDANAGGLDFGVGTGFGAYPLLVERFAGLRIEAQRLPRAREIARLAERDWQRGNTVSAAQALPVYLRDQVAFPKRA
jgi:tRNA threonylcarbamoyladenosine biosynthesis protein TsaB